MGKSPRSRNKAGQASTAEAAWLDDGQRAMPRADVETYERSKIRQRFLRWWFLLWGFGGPMILIGYAALLPAFFSAQEAVKAAATSHTEVNTDAKRAATSALQDWLDAEPGPLPGGHLISWDGVESFKPSEQVETDDGVETVPGYEVHAFTLGTGGTAEFISRIQVSIDEDLGPLVQGNPSIEPVVPTALTEADPWPGTSPAAIAEPVVQAAASWADTYTSGDPGRLRLVTGDPEANHSYLPMTGAKGMANFAAGAAAVRDDGLTVLRVSFVPLWDLPEEQPELDAEGQPIVDVNVDVVDPETAQPVTYDVLVDKADTASPVVVAWGGPSGIDDLEPFGNALVGIDLEQTVTLVEEEEEEDI